MPTKKPVSLPNLNQAADQELDLALGEAGQSEFKRLLRVLRAFHNHPSLVLIESDFSPKLRFGLLERLADVLSEHDIASHIIRLTFNDWDIASVFTEQEAMSTSGVVFVFGLEDTPGIIGEVGTEHLRPTAIASLNNAREVIRKNFKGTLVVWCDLLSYEALQEHSPDFFDYFSANVSFKNANLQTIGTYQAVDLPDLMLDKSFFPSTTPTVETLRFYEEQIANSAVLSLDKAHAFMGFAESIISSNERHDTDRLMAGKAALEEALLVFEKTGHRYDWARAQILMTFFLKHLHATSEDKIFDEIIDRYHLALSVFDRVKHREAWAGAHQFLGFHYIEAGDKYVNKAIQHYEMALSAVSKTRDSFMWASIETSLASAILNLPNLTRTREKEAVLLCEDVISIFKEQTHPEGWALAQFILGALHLKAVSKNRDIKTRKAIACFEAALRVYRKHQIAESWKGVLHALSSAHLLMRSDNRVKSLRAAEKYCDQAIELGRKSNDTTYIAKTHSLMAKIYMSLAMETKAGRYVWSAIHSYDTAISKCASAGLKEEVDELTTEKQNLVDHFQLDEHHVENQDTITVNT